MSYTIIDNDFIEIEKLSNGAFRLYVILKKMCFGNKNSCFPSQEYLASRLDKSVRTIQRYIEELIEYGIVIKKRRGSISNVYVLCDKVTSQEDKENHSIKNNAQKSYFADEVAAKEKNNNYVKVNKAYSQSKVIDKSPSNKDNSFKSQNKKHYFNAYEQRSYNYKNLEAMLLGERSYDEELLYAATTSCD